MVMETEMVDVIFRVDREGEVFALMPGLAGNLDPRTCSSYQHVGQHASADLAFCLRRSRAATAEEARPLLRELQQIGYVVNVISNATRSHYRQRVRQV